MYHFKLRGILFLIFTVSISFAQKTNQEKIIGCWTLTKMEYSQPQENSAKLINDALNRIICFDKNGKFINKSDKDSETITGEYSFSEDGKTIIQSMEMSREENEKDPHLVAVNSNAQIRSLDEKTLILELDIVMMHFERK